MSNENQIVIDYLVNVEGDLVTKDNPLVLNILTTVSIRKLSINNYDLGINRIIFKKINEDRNLDIKNKIIVVNNKSELTNLRIFFDEIIRYQIPVKKIIYPVESELLILVNQFLKYE